MNLDKAAETVNGNPGSNLYAVMDSSARKAEFEKIAAANGQTLKKFSELLLERGVNPFTGKPLGDLSFEEAEFVLETMNSYGFTRDQINRLVQQYPQLQARK
jgi:hypothetical protein